MTLGAMMKFNEWNEIAELVGIAAVVGSLIFVGLQMRQDQEIALAQAFVDTSAVITDLNQLITNNKAVWINGLDGAELSLEENLTFRALCRANYMRKISHWVRAQRLDAGDPSFIAQSFAYEIYIYPGLRRYFGEVIDGFEERRSLFGHTGSDDSFTSAVEASLAILDRTLPPPPKTKSYLIN